MPYVSRRKDAFREIRDELGPVAEQMAEATSEEIVGLMRRSDPSGEEYGHPEGGTYEASAPGEPPAVRTGQYADSYGHTEWTWRSSEKRAVAAVTSDRKTPSGAFLWPFLEYGTVSVAPRPHVRPSAETVAGAFRRAARRTNRRGPAVVQTAGGEGARALPPAA